MGDGNRCGRRGCNTPPAPGSLFCEEHRRYLPREPLAKMRLKQPVRPFVSLAEFGKVCRELQEMVPEIRKVANPGAFLHPHEILGMMDDQHLKMAQAVTQSLYTSDVEEVKHRCLKYAYGLLFAAASLNVISEDNVLQQNGGENKENTTE